MAGPFDTVGRRPNPDDAPMTPGDPESFTCRWCGGWRQLTPARPGRPRAMVCPTCDAPDDTPEAG